ncbi:MAG: flagellar basal-body rod protein FlgB [Actinoplanes sp.]|jgi:flagellar basal-body rod protein FlgB|nr:flagellar basal-body rod protein FlgB [Actinoplanes sp.]MDT5039820.1 flagellar basal-body rod protein FlgB [Actinoplanes sp.]
MDGRPTSVEGKPAVFDDLSTSSLRVAVAGLAARQNAIADNIANIETPGYQARKVKFEEALTSAVQNGQPPASVRPSVHTSLEPTRLNGSNVNLDEETLSHIDTTMRYQLTLRALDSKYSMLRTAITGS